MSEMVERAANAMRASKAWPAVFGAGTAEVLAQAAIAAMREPTEAMLVAVKPRPQHWSRQDAMQAAMNAAVKADQMALRSEWIAMIDAALSPTPPQGDVGHG